MVAKHSINPKIFSYAATRKTAQTTVLPEDFDGKIDWNGANADIELITVLGEKGQDKFHRRKPHLDLTSKRYPRVIDTLET